MVDFQQLKKVTLCAIGVTMVLVLGLYQYNTDHKRNLLSKPTENLELPFISDDKFQQVLDKYENFCINGKDRTLLNTQEQYEEFLKGPCAPMIILPGIMGTSLQLKIDCEVLKEKNPEIFSNCGWQTCSRFNIFKRKPDNEYRIWIGDFFSKTNFLQLSKDSKCFGDLIGLAYNKEINKLESKEGLEVTWYGNTEETKQYKTCGANAIRDFTNDLILKELSCSIRGFANLLDLLDAMGYQSGLTYQSVPYDFRQEVAQSDTQSIIPKAIDHMYELNGKKVVLLGHSLGNLHILNSLNNIPQSTKDLKVKQFIAAGPPFLGAPKAFINMLGGDPDYLKTVFGKQVGMNYYSQMSFTQSCSSALDLVQKDTFDRFKNEEWMKELIRRIEYEETNSYDGKKPYSLLPDPDQPCVNTVFKARGQGQCKSGIYNLQKEVILRVNGEEYKATYKDVQEVITKYATYNVDETLNLLTKSFQAEGLHDILNPNVPVTIVYGNMLETRKSFTYNKDTKKVFEETNSFYFPDKVENGLGDGTTPTFSALVPGLKWSYEFEKQKENSKPVKLIEFCSNINRQKPFYDSSSSSGEYLQTESEYRGMDCDCSQGKDMGNCYHSCFINDSNFVTLMAQSVITREKSNITQSKYTQEELEQLIDSCPALQL